MSRRIALISEHASPIAPLGGIDGGGQNVYVGHLARQLAQSGYEVDVFTRRDSSGLPETAEWVEGVRIVNVPAGPPAPVPKEDLLPYMNDFADFACAFHAHAPYDLAHANFWMSGLVASELKRRTGLPFVITFHALGRVRRSFQGPADRFPNDRFVVEDRLIAEADHIVAECPQEEEDLLHHYGADPAKISVIPAGFDTEELRPLGKELARSVLGLDTEGSLIVHVGRMVPRKGVDNVIRGLGRLVHEREIDAQLAIVGGDAPESGHPAAPEIERLRAVAAEERVTQRVRFLGPAQRERLKHIYSAADVFVTTPWYEPFGITPVEAMACGTPVIGSNVGGIKFTVRDGETGYLVPPCDPDVLADRMAHLLRHPSVLELFRRQAIRRANDLFSWRRVACAMAALYERVLTAADADVLERTDELAAIDRTFHGALDAIGRSRELLSASLMAGADAMSSCLKAGGKLLICGNEESAAQAQHFVAAMAARFKRPDRPGLPAVAIGWDPAALRLRSENDPFEDGLARRLDTIAGPDDVLIGLSADGRSASLMRVFEAARERGMGSIAVLGGDGGRVRSIADVPIVVPHDDVDRIQEVHLLVIHTLCELTEERLLGASWTASHGAVERSALADHVLA